MPALKDQTGRTITINSPASRIISLVPSITELLSDLGLDHEVIGITKFCIRPPGWLQSKTRVGGTKQLNIKRINQLHPDLIIGNKEENVKSDIEFLSHSFPVWVTDVNTVEDAYHMIEQVGRITGKEEKAEKIIQEIKGKFADFQSKHCAENLKSIQTAYLIWRGPYMAAGGNTFINAMLAEAGFTNFFKDRDRYPEISIDDLRGEESLSNKKCELILLSSEPFPFKESHVNELQSYLPETKIRLVDGQIFSWYGSRMLYAPSYFEDLQGRI